MKLSLKTLQNFLDLDDISPEELAKKLTMRSFEVEEISSIGADLKGPILVAKILDIQKHPNADRLSVTKVTTDGKNEIQIVCGAKNIEIGQIVPASLEGAEVVNRQDGSKLKIKKSKIRDVESFGMLCSPGELGILDGEQSGILILPPDAPLGENIIDYLSLHKDIVLDVGARSNRGDALSVYGMSKEISALTGKKVNDLKFIEPNINKSIDIITPKIEDLEDTFLFYTVTIENIKVQDSPRWLKNALLALNARSINNIVDITNYISLVFGQPMHAYDKDKLNGKSLISRLSKCGEKITTLDGELRELKEGVLVISDEKAPQAIAGVMGGNDSAVSDSTKSIVFEAAVFNPYKVRRNSRSVGLASEASKRFERGVDSNFTYKALLKAIEMTLKIGGNENISVSTISKAGNPKIKNIKIRLQKKEIKRVLGIEIENSIVQELLSPLDFTFLEVNSDYLDIQVPPHRQEDVTRPIDLIEEIARLYGYDNIPNTAPSISPSFTKLFNGKEKVKSHFLAAGFSETYISSLVGDQITGIKEFSYDFDKAVRMLNPLSREHSVLRQSLIPGLIESLKLNQSHQASFIRLFEIGKTYFVNKLKTVSKTETTVDEIENIAGIFFGQEESWISEKKNKVQAEDLFYRLKGVLEGLFLKNHISYEFQRVNYPFFHPNYSIKIIININNKSSEIGHLGCLHPKLEKSLDFKGPVAVFELSIDNLISELEHERFFSKISSMPIVERDLTIDLLKSIDSSDIYKSLSSIISKNVIDIKVISTFDLDQDNKSLTYRFRMQKSDDTLTTKEVEEEITVIKNHLIAKFNCNFRG